MADNNQNRLPAGATLVSGTVPPAASASSSGSLPPGATLVSGTVPSASSDTPPASSSWLADTANAIGEFGAGVVPGAIESAGETIQSLPYVGKKIISPEAMQLEREMFKPGSPAEQAGQHGGMIAESAMEFVLGDEALKGLALSDKIGLASKIAQISKDSPYIGKLIQHGVNAARMGTVGYTEALAKGASQSSAVKTGIATGVGGETLDAAIEAAPSFINPFRKALLGEKVAQAPAQAAAREAVTTGGAEVGVNSVQPASLRTIVEQPIGAVNSLKKNIYGQVDRAAGTDIKTLYDKLDAINDKIDLEASGSPEEARLEAQRTSQMQTIDDAKQVARGKGVDVDKMLAKGDALHLKEMALRDLQKNVFKNVNVVAGNTAAGTRETVNIDAAIKAVQKLQDNTKFGAPRLEQALGKDGAKKFINELYAAQRAGQNAVPYQTVSRWLAGVVGAGLVGGTAVEGVRSLMGH